MVCIEFVAAAGCKRDLGETSKVAYAKALTVAAASATPHM